MRPATRRWRGALVTAALLALLAGGCSSTNQKNSKAAASAGDAAPLPGAPGGEAAPAGELGAAPPTDGAASSDTVAPSVTGGSSPSAGPKSGAGSRPKGGATSAGGGPAAGTSGSGGAGSPSAGSAAGTPGGSTGGGGAPGKPGGPAAPTPVPSKLLGPETGQGFTASTINIGITLIDETSSRGAGLIGAKSTDFGNTKLQAQAIVNWVNAHGGMAGRKVVPIFHTINILTETWDTSGQGSCSAFTEDNKTFAGLAAVIQLSEVFTRCLAQHNTLAVVDGRAVRDDKMIGELGDSIWMPGRVSANRWAALTVDGLAELGYFDAGAKVGLIRFDMAPLNRAASEVLKPRLAARRVAVVSDEIISHPESVNGFGATSAQISNAVLRMRAAGVTHLLPIDDHGIMVFLLGSQAESQGFRPRYGVSTNNLPFVMEENSPKEQLRNAVGVGWLPGDDVADARTPDSEPEKVCTRILKDAGAALPSRYAYSNAMNYCDSLLFIQAALSRAPNVSPAGFKAGAAALGVSYASPYTFGTDFGHKRIDGAAAWRAFRFQPDCSCFRYEGGNRLLP